LTISPQFENQIRERGTPIDVYALSLSKWFVGGMPAPTTIAPLSF
jgi:hypothetical protein